MTADASSGGVLRRLRYVLLLLLVALLALAPVSPVHAADAAEPSPSCPAAAPPNVQAAIGELLIFVEQFRANPTTPPTNAEIEAKLAQLFGLVDYLLAEAGKLTDEEVALLLGQAEAMLQAEGVPQEHVTTALTTLGNILNAETPPTPEQALDAILASVKPYLATLGVTDALFEAMRTYLLQFLPDTKDCPKPGPGGDGQPTETPGPPGGGAAAETTTSTGGRGLLATTGIDPILLLGVVAIAMIAGGLALEAGQRRPARRRFRR
jgi:hypothetical protein